MTDQKRTAEIIGLIQAIRNTQNPNATLDAVIKHLNDTNSKKA